MNIPALKHSIILSLFIGCTCFTLLAQSSKSPDVNTLTHEQMREDFDYLYKWIKTMPYLEIKKQLTGTDILAEIGELRFSIDTISTEKEFYSLITKTLNLAQDIHACPILQMNIPVDNQVLLEQAKKNSQQYADKYYWNKLIYKIFVTISTVNIIRQEFPKCTTIAC